MPTPPQPAAPKGSAAAAASISCPSARGQCLRLDADRRLTGPHSATQGASWRRWRNGGSPAIAGRPSPPTLAGGEAAPKRALPFTGGWLLYLGYELATEIEPTLDPAAERRSGHGARHPHAGGLDSRPRQRRGLGWWPSRESTRCSTSSRLTSRESQEPHAQPPSGTGSTSRRGPRALSRRRQPCARLHRRGEVYQTNLSRAVAGDAAPRRSTRWRSMDACALPIPARLRP